MENITQIEVNTLRQLLAQLVEANRSNLVSHYQRVLRETLFVNRPEMRPGLIKNIASDEADALLNFLRQPVFAGTERGAQLYQTGLSELVILRLVQIMRQFFLPYLKNGQIAPMLEIVDTYQEAVIHGFIQSLEKNIFIEQERIRNAFQRASDHR